jgi:putative transposase
MRKSRFCDDQVILIRREQEAGRPMPGLCSEHGIGIATFYKWKAQFGGMEVSKAKRLETIEGETANGGSFWRTNHGQRDAEKETEKSF